MAKCPNCGKAGWLLRLGRMGMCRECERAQYEWNAGRQERWEAIGKKYQKLYGTHNALLEEIHKLYAIANGQKAYNSQIMDTCISLCWEDIELVPLLKHARMENHIAMRSFPDRVDREYEESKSFEAYTRLAIIYEKRKEYDKAVDVCRKAISDGYVKDGSKGGMHGRLSRLCRKAGVDFDADIYVSENI